MSNRATANSISLAALGGGEGRGEVGESRVCGSAHLVSGIFGKVSGRTAVRSSRPSPDLSPFPPEAYPAGERGTDPVSSFNPNSCLGARARTSKEGSGRMPQQGRIVGIDVSKLKAEACIRSLQQRLSEPSTPQGEAALIAWLRANAVAL